MRLLDLNDTVLMRVMASRVPMMFLGKPGLGKTERFMQFTKDNDLGMVPFNLTTIEPPDVRGFAIPSKREDGVAVTKFTLSPILEAIARDGHEHGILFLDELLACEHIIQKAVAPILSERTVGEQHLPPGWAVWMASNRTEDRSGVVRLLGHVTNRIGIVDIQPDGASWLAWAQHNNVHPLYIAFVKTNPAVVFDNDVPKDTTKPYCTPRSLINAMRLHTQGLSEQVYMNLPTDPITQEFIAGLIGQGAAAMLMASLKVVGEIPTLEEILADPHNAKVPNDTKLAAQIAAAQMVVHYADASNIDPLFIYVERLNKEFQVSSVTQMLERSAGALMNSQALTHWLARNKALVVATTAD